MEGDNQISLRIRGNAFDGVFMEPWIWGRKHTNNNYYGNVLAFFLYSLFSFFILNTLWFCLDKLGIYQTPL